MNLKCRLLIIFYTTLELLEAYELRFDLQFSNISQMMKIMASHFNNLESGAPYLDGTVQAVQCDRWRHSQGYSRDPIGTPQSSSTIFGQEHSIMTFFYATNPNQRIRRSMPSTPKDACILYFKGGTRLQSNNLIKISGTFGIFKSI